MGIKMPSTWNFDQFAEISMGTDWAIDKDAYSGRFDAVSFLDSTSYQQANKPENPASRPNILSILPTIQEIENLYYQCESRVKRG